MTLDSTWAVFGAGLMGGVCTELLHWWNLRQQEVLPAYAMRPFYWIITGLLILAGGGVAVLYFGSHADGMIVLHVGAGTPLILQKLASSIPEPKGARSASLSVGGPSWRRFFRW